MSDALGECVLLTQAWPCQGLSSDPCRKGKAFFLAEAQGKMAQSSLESELDTDSVCSKCSPYLSHPGYLQSEDYSPAEMPPTETSQTHLLDLAADHSPCLLVYLCLTTEPPHSVACNSTASVRICIISVLHFQDAVVSPSESPDYRS